jgi:hypothetical protein
MIHKGLSSILVKLGTGDVGVGSVILKDNTGTGITFTQLDESKPIGDLVLEDVKGKYPSILITFENLESIAVVEEMLQNAKNNLIKIEQEVLMLEDFMQIKFPGCHYTTTIVLWDDGDYRIQVRHGNEEGNLLNDYVLDKGEIKFEENTLDTTAIITDKTGKEYYVKYVGKEDIEGENNSNPENKL